MFKLVFTAMCLHALWEAVPSQPASLPALLALTFFDNIDNVIGIEAEFICVLSIIGIQSLALWHLRLRLGLGLGSAPCWGRPTGRLSPDPVERERRQVGDGTQQEVAAALCGGLDHGASTGLLKFKSSSILRRICHSLNFL